MTIARPRSAWQLPAQPVTGPALNRSAVVDFVVHYPGTDWVDLDFDNDGRITEQDSVKLLRSMQSVYLNDPSRGYSLGYSFAIFPAGDAWTIRGLDFVNAANKGRSGVWNRTSISVLVVVDDADPMTPSALRTLWTLVDSCSFELGRPLNVRRHGDGDATACPGAGITAQLAAGRPIPTSTPTPEDPDTMNARRIRLRGTINEFLIGAGPPLHLTPELAKTFESVPYAGDVGRTPQLEASLRAAGFTPELVVPLGGWR